MSSPPIDPHTEGPKNHDYLSTACYHELHERCRLVCKFCETPCACICHQEGGEHPFPEGGGVFLT